MAKKFDFVEAYRKGQPNASQAIIEARKKSHDKLYADFKTMTKVYELCRLAFEFPQELTSLIEWLEPAVKEFDPRFSLSIDSAESARIASLLLRDLISRGSPQGAFAVLICSFGGLRIPIDDQLLVEARDAVVESGRAQRIVLAEKKIAAPAMKDLKDHINAIQGGWNPESVRAALEVTVTEARSALVKTAQLANDAHQALRSDVIRLAEEVDMLWWHVGDWSERLGRARTDLPKEAVGVLSGIELGQLVSNIPGPFGVYGILRRTLGKQSEKKAKLKDVIRSFGDGTSKLATKIPDSAKAVFPVHSAILLASEYGLDGWASHFDEKIGLLASYELPHFDLSVQAFRERVLIKYAGLGE